MRKQDTDFTSFQMLKKTKAVRGQSWMNPARQSRNQIPWSVATCRRFPTTRHLTSNPSADMSAHSKNLRGECVARAFSPAGSSGVPPGEINREAMVGGPAGGISRGEPRESSGWPALAARRCRNPQPWTAAPQERCEEAPSAPFSELFSRGSPLICVN